MKFSNFASPNLEGLNGEIVTVISSKLTHEGEPTKKGTPAKCDYAVITFKHGDREGRGTVFAKNARMVQRDVDRDGPTDYRVAVTPYKDKLHAELKSLAKGGCETVYSRAVSVSQPNGGYIPPQSLTVSQIDEGELTIPSELNPAYVGLSVQYMATYIFTGSYEKATEISHKVLFRMPPDDFDRLMELDHAFESSNDRLDQMAIMYAVSCYDKLYREGRISDRLSPVISMESKEFLMTLVDRILSFFHRHGVVELEMDFRGGYTSTVRTGDGDILTKDGVWDVKVSKNEPNANQTLQVLMYYLMGTHSIHRELYQDLTKIGLYNPLKGREYWIELSTISKETLKSVENDVIGYDYDTTPSHSSSVTE